MNLRLTWYLSSSAFQAGQSNVEDVNVRHGAPGPVGQLVDYLSRKR
jgi:hypothetical protein